MPIYEYECVICDFHFERKQRFDEEPAAICPRCEGKAHRVIHSVPIIYKGSGFYTTDNRKNSGVGEKNSGVGEPAEGTSDKEEGK